MQITFSAALYSNGTKYDQIAYYLEQYYKFYSLMTSFNFNVPRRTILGTSITEL